MLGQLRGGWKKIASLMPPQTRPQPITEKKKAAKGAAKGATKTVKKVSKKDSAAPVPTASLISDRIERAQALKAFKALNAYVARVRAEKSTNELPLGGADFDGASRDTENTVWIQITVKELNTQRKVKPAAM